MMRTPLKPALSVVTVMLIAALHAGCSTTEERSQSTTTPSTTTADADDDSSDAEARIAPRPPGVSLTTASCTEDIFLGACDWLHTHDAVILGTITSVEFVQTNPLQVYYGPDDSTPEHWVQQSVCANPDDYIVPVLLLDVAVESSSGADVPESITLAIGNMVYDPWNPRPSLPPPDRQLSWVSFGTMEKGEPLQVGQQLVAAVTHLTDDRASLVDAPGLDVWATFREPFFTVRYDDSDVPFVDLQLIEPPCTEAGLGPVEINGLTPQHALTELGKCGAPSPLAVERAGYAVNSPHFWAAICSEGVVGAPP